jgi:hypothetical protein
MRTAVRAAGLIALSLVGCEATEEAPQPAPAPEVSVTVLQQRVDEATRTVGVEATNHGRTPVHVSSVRLSGGGLDSRASPLDTDLQPGLTVALRTSYGSPDCDDRDDPVVATLEVDGRAVELPVDGDGQQEVDRLLDVDCARQTLAATTGVRLAGPYRTVGGAEPRLRGRLVLQRREPGPPVDVRSLGGSVLVDLRPVDEPVDLGSDADRAVTPVLLGSTGRCDAHALGGSTQTFLLSAYVILGDAAEQRVVLTPPPSVQDQVLRVVDRACDAEP